MGRWFSSFLFQLGILIFVIPPTHAAAANKPNIILITLDSIRADRVGFLDARHPTPALDGLAKQSIVFEHAYAQAPLTVVSHATILTGTYPQTNHASELGTPLAADAPYLPDALHTRGYYTAGFVGSSSLDPRNGFAPGFNRGFDVYECAERTQMITRATARLGHLEVPLFLWINISSPPVSAESYSATVSSSDAALGRLLTALRQQKLYDDAIIILLSDHGESLGAHGEDTHGILLYDETIHVPLVLKLPQNHLSGKRIATHVRLLDIAPTVLEAAGLPVPSQMQGQSLLRIAKGNSTTDLPVYSRSDFPQQAFGWSVLESWRTGKYLYIRAPKPELYDLSADPNATHNLAQSSKAILQTIAAQLDAFDSHFSPHGSAGGTELTSSEMQKLASLGYVGLQKTSSAGARVEGTDPKYEIAIANQTLSAISALEQDKLDKAIAGFQQVLSSHADIYLAQYGLGRALAQKKSYADAIQHLHKAIELQPDSTWANYEIGKTLMKTGDFKSAAVHLEIASSRLPESSQTHSLLSQVYEKLGRKDDASREHTRAIQLGGKP
jgi:choline-sulfatase